MISLPTRLSQIAGPVVITVLALLAYGLGDGIESSLIYDRQSINSLEYWRLLTGNFLHTNTAHFFLNLAGLWLLWLLHGDEYKTRHYLVVFIACCVGVGLGLYAFTPEITRYVGLSGALHGVFFYGILNDISHKMKTGWLLLLGGCAKIVNEQFGPTNASLEQLIDASVAVDAHLYGAITGAIIFGLTRVVSNFKKRQQQI